MPGPHSEWPVNGGLNHSNVHHKDRPPSSQRAPYPAAACILVYQAGISLQIHPKVTPAAFSGGALVLPSVQQNYRPLDLYSLGLLHKHNTSHKLPAEQLP